jgi:Protein of unknown function (DUF3467)
MEQPKLTTNPPLLPEQVLKLIHTSEDFTMRYFNHARIATTYTDVRIFLGQHNVTATGTQTFEEQLCVILAPEFANTLAELLGKILKTYESQFGQLRPIPQPPPSTK